MLKNKKHDYYNSKINWFRKNGYKEIQPLQFYRNIFSEGSFQNPLESNGDYRPNGLLQYRGPYHGENSMSCCVINDDLKTIQDCIERKGRYKNHEFVLISGCSYIGSQKTNKNARFCHAIIIDIDEVDADNLSNLLGMAYTGLIPIPSSIVVSGNGIHVVYILDAPIPLYYKKAEMLKNLKMMLIRKLWNEKTSKDPNVQYQGIVQGYRAVGTKTKLGHTVRAYQIGNPITIDELINTITELDIVPFLKPNKKMASGKINSQIYSERIKHCMNNKHFSEELLQELTTDDKWTMAELKNKNPDWFEDWYKRRIIEKQKAGHLHIGRTPYDKWLKEIKIHARQGNRRMCIYCLAAFAQKCDISEDEFQRDAYSLFEPFNDLTVDKNNPFKKSDIDWAVQQYKEANLIKMSLLAMEKMTGIKYPVTERNHNPNGIKGRPSIEEKVLKYLKTYPSEKNISKIVRECNCSRPTIYKYINLNQRKDLIV